MGRKKPGKTSAQGKVIGCIIYNAILPPLLVLAAGFVVGTKRYRDILCLLPYHKSHELLPQTLWSRR